MTIGDLVKWCKGLQKARRMLDGWSEAALTLEIRKRANAKELVVFSVENEIFGAIIFHVDKEKREFLVENIFSNRRGTCGVMMRKMLELYNVDHKNETWKIWGLRDNDPNARKYGRNFKITDSFLRKLYLF